MKRRVLKWSIALGLTAVGLVILFDQAAASYLRRHSERFQREVADIKQSDTAYRRPLVFGEPLEQNAAVWYEQALRHFSADSLKLASAVVRGGPTQVRTTMTPLVAARCAETRSTRIQNALRCTYCNWHIGFGLDALQGIEDIRTATMLGDCLTIDGHQAMANGDMNAAATAYLKALSLACDLGVGTSGMAFAGTASAIRSLTSLVKITMASDDPELLNGLSRELAKASGRLPDGKVAIQRERLWLENVIVLEKLAYPGVPVKGIIGRVKAWRGFTAWRLWREESLLWEFDRLRSARSADEAATLIESVRRRAQKSVDPIVSIIGLEKDAQIRASAFDLATLLRATQITITLQQWRIAHGKYPAEVEALNLSPDSEGLRYESIGDGAGYKLIGARGTLVETPLP